MKSVPIKTETILIEDISTKNSEGSELNLEQIGESNKIENKENIDKILKCIRLLPENQQKVIRLQSINDCSISEIEEITGFSNMNIRSYLSRGSKQLRKLFDKNNLFSS